jgi:hypothetical protein
MKIFAINNAGAGYADQVDVEPGTTVQTLFNKMVPGGQSEDYLIRVNRLPATRDQVLQEGDRASFTAVKIQGAHRARMDPRRRAR